MSRPYRLQRSYRLLIVTLNQMGFTKTADLMRARLLIHGNKKLSTQRLFKPYQLRQKQTGPKKKAKILT